MIETICPHCGNRKSFDDAYAGRTFRCPNCKEPVTIQNIEETVQTNDESHKISFDEEFKKAEQAKIRKEKERQFNQLKRSLLGYKMAFVFISLYFLIGGIWAIADEPSQLGAGIAGLLILLGIAAFISLLLYKNYTLSKAKFEKLKADLGVDASFDRNNLTDSIKSKANELKNRASDITKQFKSK